MGRGEGNSCSVEFNHVYHVRPNCRQDKKTSDAVQWHAIVSQADEKWTEAVFTKIFGTSKPFDQVRRGP